MQAGFTPDRGTIDTMLTVLIALAVKSTISIHFVHRFTKSFDSVPRAALFKALRRFGLPANFVNIVIRLHEGAKIKVKIGEGKKSASTIGERQGSCERSVLFVFIV